MARLLTKLGVLGLWGCVVLVALAIPAGAVTVKWDFTGGNEGCNKEILTGPSPGCTTAEFEAMPHSLPFNSVSPDNTRVLDASAWAAQGTSKKSKVTAPGTVKLGHHAKGLGVTVATNDNPRLDKDGRLEFAMFELGQDDFDPLKVVMDVQREPNFGCGSNPTDCFFHDVDLRIWIGGAGPDGNLFAGDGGLRASVNSLNGLNNGTFKIGGVGFVEVFKGGDFDQNTLTIFLCGPGAPAGCAPNFNPGGVGLDQNPGGVGAGGHGIGGTTGRYVIIDWPDAAFLTQFEGAVPTQVPTPASLLLLGSGLVIAGVVTRRRLRG